MTSLNDLLAKNSLPSPKGTARDISGQIKAAIRSTSSEIRNIPGGLINQQVQAAKNNVSGIIGGGLADLRGAVNKALTGDFSGALTQIQQGPQNIMGTLGSVFGLESGSTLKPGGALGAVNTLQGALDRADPMLSFQWYCELPQVTPIGGTPQSLGWNYVEEATPAFRNFDTRRIFRQGRNAHYASTYSVDNLRLNLYADIANQSLNYLMAWEGAILAPFSAQNYTLGGGFGRPSGYKKPIRLYLVAPNRSLVVMLEYIECWPTNLDALHLDSGSSTRLTYNVNFSTGDVFPQAFGINNNVAGGSLLNQLALDAGDLVVPSI